MVVMGGGSMLNGSGGRKEGRVARASPYRKYRIGRRGLESGRPKPIVLSIKKRSQRSKWLLSGEAGGSALCLLD